MHVWQNWDLQAKKQEIIGFDITMDDLTSV